MEFAPGKPAESVDFAQGAAAEPGDRLCGPDGRRAGSRARGGYRASRPKPANVMVNESGCVKVLDFWSGEAHGQGRK